MIEIDKRRRRHVSSDCPACGAELLLDETRYRYMDSWLGKAIGCPWCSAVLECESVVIVCTIPAPKPSAEAEVQT